MSQPQPSLSASGDSGSSRWGRSPSHPETPCGTRPVDLSQVQWSGTDDFRRDNSFGVDDPQLFESRYLSEPWERRLTLTVIDQKSRTNGKFHAL